MKLKQVIALICPFIFSFSYAKVWHRSDNDVLVLSKGESLYSDNGQFSLKISGKSGFDLSEDSPGLQVYRQNYLVINSEKLPKLSDSELLYLRAGGDLALEDSSGNIIWQTDAKDKGEYLNFQSDGNLVLYSSDDKPVWSSDTSQDGGPEENGTQDEFPLAKQPVQIIKDLSFRKNEVVVANYILHPSEDDDTSNIKATLAKCKESFGGVVWLSSGEYNISEEINIPPYCELKGDWEDPESKSFNDKYGTVIRVNIDNSIKKSAFKLSSNSALDGVTIYYPNQKISDVEEYPYAISILGGTSTATVKNITLLNAYNGIYVGGPSIYDQSIPDYPHELIDLSNIRGTALNNAIQATNSSDVSRWTNINFSSKYWSQYDKNIDQNKVKKYMANGTGFILSGLEWDQFINIDLADYKIGIHFVSSPRIQFSGSFINTNIFAKEEAVLIDENSLDARWGIGFTYSSLHGNKSSITNNTEDSTIWMSFSDIPDRKGGKYINGEQIGVPKPPKFEDNTMIPEPQQSIINAGDDEWGLKGVSPNNKGVLPIKDTSDSLQKALDSLSSNGGGILYIPPGWYKIEKGILIPSNVELRGATPFLHRDNRDILGGTVFFVYGAKEVIAMNGPNSGINGIQLFYPLNNPKWWQNSDCFKQMFNYDFSIRSNSDNNYAKNIGISNATNGLSFSSNHYISKIVGTAFKDFISVEKSDRGYINFVHANINTITRVPYNIYDWILEESDRDSIFWKTVDSITRQNESLISIENVKNENIIDAFIFGGQYGINSKDISSAANVYNIGTDQLGGYTVKTTDKTNINIQNLMRVWGDGSGDHGINIFNDIVMDEQGIPPHCS